MEREKVIAEIIKLTIEQSLSIPPHYLWPKNMNYSEILDIVQKAAALNTNIALQTSALKATKAATQAIVRALTPPPTPSSREKKQNHNRRQQNIMDCSDANGLSSLSAISNKYNKSNLVIGGIDCKKENKYITEYNRFEKQEMTDKEQLIMEKRLKSVRMLPDPAQAKSRVNSSYDDDNIISSFNNNNKTNNSGDSTILVSSDYRASTYATKSFISNIGTLIR